MKLLYKALPTKIVREFQSGALDENGQPPEQTISDGIEKPCRHCLMEIPAGKRMLTLAFRPITNLHPYSEVGPIFLCGEKCERHSDGFDLPEMFASWEKTLIRGYDSNGKIVYGTGDVIDMKQVPTAASEILDDQNVSFVHLRSKSYNCYQCRIERAKPVP